MFATPARHRRGTDKLEIPQQPLNPAVGPTRAGRAALEYRPLSCYLCNILHKNTRSRICVACGNSRTACVHCRVQRRCYRAAHALPIPAFAMTAKAPWNDIRIDESRLKWCPGDSVKVEQGGTLLGEGAFGSVYRGEMDGDSVAIKVIKAQAQVGAPNSRAIRKAAEKQHAREIRRLMELRFRHVVQCYGVSLSSASSDLLLVNECLDGGSLHQSLNQARQANVELTEISLLTICSHVAKGLRYIHNRYIHGDLKPHNILLNAGIVIDSDKGIGYFPRLVEAKVADFGMSRRLKSDEHSLAKSSVEFSDQPFGSWSYMAPESFGGARDLNDSALKSVDVFAFGVLLYEMLSGMTPWRHEGVVSPMHLYRLVVFEKRRPHWGTRPVKDEYRKLVEKCWDDDFRCRPTAIELSETFDRWLKEARRKLSRVSHSSGDGADTDCQQRRYWEKRGSSLKYSIPVQAMGSGNDIGASTGTKARGPATVTHAQNVALLDTGSNGLDLTMVDITVTRVQTKKLMGPSSMGLDLPITEDLASHSELSKARNDFLNDSMLDAVLKYNANTCNPATEQGGLCGTVKICEDLGEKKTERDFCGSQENDSEYQSVGTLGPYGEASAVASIQLELPIASSPVQLVPDSALMRADSITDGIASEEAFRQAVIISPASDSTTRSEECAPSPLSRATVQPSTAHLRLAHGQVPSIHQSLGMQTQQTPALNVHATMPSHVQKFTQPSISDVLLAMRSPDGFEKVRSWWQEGFAVVIASAIAQEDKKFLVFPRLEFVVELLQYLTASQRHVNTAANAKIATNLCTALGHAFRGGCGNQEAAERALPVIVSSVQVFKFNISACHAACYAIGNCLRVSNEIVSDGIRAQVADCISDVILMNLKNQRGGQQPTLAYTTAACARNFVWRSAKNANLFFARRRRGAANAVHPSAAENSCASMLFFRRDPTVVEAVLSAYAALATVSAHHPSLIKIGVVNAVACVLDRPITPQSLPLMMNSLAMLRVIVSSPSMVKSDRVVDVFIEEGGVSCVLKTFISAVQARDRQVVEESLFTMGSISRSDDRLGNAIIHTGGMYHIIQAVFASAEPALGPITVRFAEVLCDVVDVLSQHAAARSLMRQTGLDIPLQTLVAKFLTNEEVSRPARQAIARIK